MRVAREARARIAPRTEPPTSPVSHRCRLRNLPEVRRATGPDGRQLSPCNHFAQEGHTLMTDQLIAGVDELRRRFESRYGQDGDPGDLATQMHEARQLHDDALEALHRQAGDRALTASEQRKWDAHNREARSLEEAAAKIETEAREARQARQAERYRRWGGLSITGNDSYGRGGAWAGLDARTETPAGWIARAHSAIETSGEGLADRAKEMLARSLSEPGGDVAARFAVVRSNPDYASAFAKVLANPERGFHTFTPAESAAFNAVEATRASWDTGTGTAGYLVPLALDPQLSALVNNGAANPLRKYGTVKTTISSPARAITSAGITAAWVAENVAFGDNTPTFGNVDIPLHKLAAFVSGSYEIFADAGESLAQALPTLLADARDRAESAAFATGNGTTAPKGIVVAVAATTGSTVTATTRGSFTSASTSDVFALLNAIPPRARQAAGYGYMGNLSVVQTLNQMVIGTAGVPLVDLAARPGLFGAPLHEASSMTASTTSGSYVLIGGDLSKYLIVDHVSGPSLEYVPVLFDQATARPAGARGWVYHHRVGADVLDGTQLRVLMT